MLDATLASEAGPTRHLVIERDVAVVDDGNVTASEAIDVIRKEMAGWGITVDETRA